MAPVIQMLDVLYQRLGTFTLHSHQETGGLWTYARDRAVAACRRVLAPGGVMSVNLFGRHASFAASAARIASVFGADQVWSLRPTREGNTVVVAGRGVVVPTRDELAARAALIEMRFGALGLPARKWLRMVRPFNPLADTAA